jgi:hypothetical protein
MKAYKVELLIIDDGDLGADAIKSVIQTTRFASNVKARVMSVGERELGNIDQNHPLRVPTTEQREFEQTFIGSVDFRSELLRAAGRALRSYQYGNSSPDLAMSIANQIDEELS